MDPHCLAGVATPADGEYHGLVCEQLTHHAPVRRNATHQAEPSGASPCHVAGRSSPRFAEPRRWRKLRVWPETEACYGQGCCGVRR